MKFEKAMKKLRKGKLVRPVGYTVGWFLRDGDTIGHTPTKEIQYSILD